MAPDILSTEATVSPVPSSSTELDTSSSYGSTKATIAKQPVQGIKPTSVGSLLSHHNTETLKHKALQPSFEADTTNSSQFAMQQATQALPSNDVTMATTSYTSEDSPVNQNLVSSSQTMGLGKTGSSTPSVPSDTSSVSIATEVSSVPKSVQSSKSISGDAVTSKELQSSSSMAKSDTKSDSVTSKYEPTVSDTVSATSSQSAGQSVSVSLTPSSSMTSSSGSSVKSHHVTLDYTVTSRDLYHTMTPSKTEFSSSALDTGSFKTTPVSSLTLTSSVKPVSTDSGGSAPLFGGE